VKPASRDDEGRDRERQMDREGCSPSAPGSRDPGEQRPEREADSAGGAVAEAAEAALAVAGEARYPKVRVCLDLCKRDPRTALTATGST